MFEPGFGVRACSPPDVKITTNKENKIMHSNETPNVRRMGRDAVIPMMGPHLPAQYNPRVPRYAGMVWCPLQGAVWHVTTSPWDLPKFTLGAAHAGTWLEDTHGWRNAARAVWAAVEMGFLISADSRAVLSAFVRNAKSVTLPSGDTIDSGSIGQWVYELCESATDGGYLNALCDEGYAFEWRGDLILTTEDQADAY